MDDAPPQPLHDDPAARHFWEGTARCEFRVLECAECHLLIHPPRPLCRRCTSFDLQVTTLSGSGTVVSISDTVEVVDPFCVHASPFKRTVVELDEQQGLLINTKIVDFVSDVNVGDTVTATFEPLASGFAGLAFRPASTFGTVQRSTSRGG